jgi:hypothetical protein
MIAYVLLGQIAIGERRTGWSGDSAEGDSIDLCIARTAAGSSRLRKRGKPIEGSRVQDPEQIAQMESLDHCASVAGLWDEIGGLQFEIRMRQGCRASKIGVMIARNVWHGVR